MGAELGPEVASRSPLLALWDAEKDCEGDTSSSGELVGDSLLGEALGLAAPGELGTPAAAVAVALRRTILFAMPFFSGAVEGEAVVSSLVLLRCANLIVIAALKLSAAGSTPPKIPPNGVPVPLGVGLIGVPFPFSVGLKDDPSPFDRDTMRRPDSVSTLSMGERVWADAEASSFSVNVISGAETAFLRIFGEAASAARAGCSAISPCWCCSWTSVLPTLPGKSAALGFEARPLCPRAIPRAAARCDLARRFLQSQSRPAAAVLWVNRSNQKSSAVGLLWSFSLSITLTAPLPSLDAEKRAAVSSRSLARTCVSR